MLAKRDSYGDTTISKRWIVAIFLMFFLFTIRSSLPTIQVSVKHHEYDDDSKISAPPEEPSIPEPPPFITDNVAVIIEDRPFDTLVPLLLHFSSVLGPGWPIVLYTSQEIIPTSPPIQRAIEERRLSIRRLPIDVRFESQDAVSEFLTMSWLWEQLAPAGHVLLFQADSIICSNAPQTVSSFLDYDWVGAPIDSTMGYGEGYNGGLSLRNRSLILDIIDQNSFRNERLTSQDPENPTVKFEDQWFVKKMRDLGARLPSLEVAKTFAVETLWYEMPLGFHQAARYQSEENLQVAYRYCPEYRIATGGAF